MAIHRCVRERSGDRIRRQKKLDPRLAGDRIAGQCIQRGVVRVTGRGHSGDSEGEGTAGTGPGGGKADGTIGSGAATDIAADHAAPAAGDGGARRNRPIDVANGDHGPGGGAAGGRCGRHGDAGHIDPVVRRDGDGHLGGTGEPSFIISNDKRGRVRADGRIRVNGTGFGGVGGAVSESPIILNNGSIGVGRAGTGELNREWGAAGDRGRLGGDGGG